MSSTYSVSDIMREVAEWQANTGAHSTYRDAYTVEAGCFCHQINDTQLSEEWNLSNGELRFRPFQCIR